VGDPHQLRHLSFLSKRRQEELFTRYDISTDKAEIFDYRSKSILDLVNETLQTQTQVGFLDEHYRSAPPIIAFSNRTFYGGALRIMTDKPGETRAHRIVVRRGTGERGPEGTNEAEARLLIEDVERQVASESRLSAEICHTIGILSPFRSQVDYIYQELAARLPFEAFQRHSVLIGTAHTFQGEERDLMFISFAVGPNSHGATLRFLERPDVFNVSITRARALQHVYVSIDPDRLESGTLLGDYLRFADASERDGREEKSANQQTVSDPFISVVAAELKRRGFETWPTYPVAGLTMDLIATREGRSCGIDLVGYPGNFETAFPIERYKMFHRAGLKIVPLSYSRWLLNKNQCLEVIESAVKQ
jgi:superfamily I DNA and/or RNA helicase